MTRRLIIIAVAVVVIGGLGFWTYDRYLGRELRQGEALRDALAEELAAAGFAFTSLEYDWRTRRVVAEGLAATQLPDNITGISIGKAIYRGADPATIRAALAVTRDKAKDSRAKAVELIADLALTDIFIGLEGGGEFKQESLTLKHVSLGNVVPRKNGPDGGTSAKAKLLEVADLARRIHVRLLEAKDARFWHPEGQVTYEQKLLRLEDYRAGNFSEFRLEGMNLAVAVVARIKLDEFFIDSVRARRFLDSLHKVPFFVLGEDIASAFAQLGTETDKEGKTDEEAAARLFPSAAQSGIIAGDAALIGFEALIPAVGRIAFEEISTTDRQYLNGLEVGGTSKIVALELQFKMLTRVLTAGLDSLGVDLAAAAAEAGSEAEAWLAARAGNSVAHEDRPVAAAMQTEAGSGSARGRRPETAPEKSEPKAEPKGNRADGPEAKEDNQIPKGPRDGEVEQGPAAPVPDVWSNEIKPPKAKPGIDNKALAEIIRKLGFDDLRIDSESVAAYDKRTKAWELSKFAFDLQKFWNLAFDVRLGGVGALEELGNVPVGATGWWQGPKADALSRRVMEEGRFERLTFTYREAGFLARLLALIAEKENTTVETVASEFVDGLFSAQDGAPLLQADGLAEAVKNFLIEPDVFAVRLQPGEPVPFSEIQTMNDEKTPLPEAASRLGLVLTLNGQTFAEFKKSVPTGSDNEGEQD